MNSNLCLCKAHKQEWKQSEYSAENCDYCKALAKIKELECQKNACQQVVSERDQRITVLEEENAELREKERGWAYVSIRYAVSERKQARMQAARKCVEIAQDCCLVPPTQWGEGAKFNAKKIRDAIKAHYGLEE